MREQNVRTQAGVHLIEGVSSIWDLLNTGFIGLCSNNLRKSIQLPAEELWISFSEYDSDTNKKRSLLIHVYLPG